MPGNIYLESTPLNEALSRWVGMLEAEGILAPLPGEYVSVPDSLGRVTAHALIAKNSSPFYHSSAMDGYAVRFSDTFGASERTPKTLKLKDQAMYVDTGDPLPEGFNAVIMIEDVQRVGGGDAIEIIAPVTPWEHVRVIGEDIVATELILPENQKIRPVDIGALRACGYAEVSVRRRPRVVVIPTGSELVEPGGRLRKGDIIESNSWILCSIAREWGGDPVRSEIVPDNLSSLKEAIRTATGEGDIVVVNAGASAGSEDFTVDAIRELGEVIMHGVSIRPGKPVILGWIDKKPVIGIPGYPVSAYITFDLFVKPLIYRMQGLEPAEPESLQAKISRQVASPPGQEEFLRVKVGKVGGHLIATPISRGAGVLMSLVRADGFVRVPAMSEGLGAGAPVEVALLRTKEEIEHTVVCIGSHDNTLDILANIFRRRYPRFSISSAHVGSMGGLMAIKRGDAHMAGTHLLDEESGEYNIPFIRRMLQEKNVSLVNLVHREQGLIVQRGNPRGIQGFQDLTRPDVAFVNRQAGSGTRLLADKCMKEQGISAGEVRGYEREEYTHMAVASAVLSGLADTGLGILASARALNLDFIPVAKERYDLAIPAEFFDTAMMRSLLDVIRHDAEFRETVLSLGGYDVSDMGRVVYEG
jgi:putative molybdopterin biosynthesis protein